MRRMCNFMGISLNEAIILSDFPERYGFSGRAISIGVPSIHFTVSDYTSATRQEVPTNAQGLLDAQNFLTCLSFDSFNFCDISASEGTPQGSSLEFVETCQRKIGRLIFWGYSQ